MTLIVWMIIIVLIVAVVALYVAPDEGMGGH